IRDLIVTGVQTCALPIFSKLRRSYCACVILRTMWLRLPGLIARARSTRAPTRTRVPIFWWATTEVIVQAGKLFSATSLRKFSKRSEERRVGKEWRERWEL